MRIFSLAVFLGFSLLAPLAWAHPPAKLDVVCDQPAQAVLLNIIHPVSDPGTHYIFKIEVFVNGKLVQEQTLDQQQDAFQQKVRYVVPGIKPKDIISVKAYCNVSGSSTVSYRVE